MQRPTSVSRLTPPGRGAVATILVSGNLDPLDKYFQPRNRKPAASQKINSIRFGEWLSSDSSREDVVFCRTADHQAEVHCHGGEAAVRRILDDLCRQGAEVVSPWSIEIAGAESSELAGLEAVTQATTERTALLLLDQVQRFSTAVRRFRSGTPDEQRDIIADMLRWTAFGRHLTSPWKIAICGRPNVGKSSLTNRLLGYERSVVFDQPGTTRDVLTSLTAIEGWPVEIIDTAGQREQADLLETEGIQRARRAALSADLTLLVIDAAVGWTESDRRIFAELSSPLVVMNKSDLAPNNTAGQEILISCTTGTGIEELMQQITHRLIPILPPPDAVYPVTPEQELWALQQAQRLGLN